MSVCVERQGVCLCVRPCCAVVSGTEAALPLASGMAAISSTLLTLLQAGDHMLIQVRGGGRLA